eukprot:7383534-Prymnesium_polylepis.1
MIHASQPRRPANIAQSQCASQRQLTAIARVFETFEGRCGGWWAARQSWHCLGCLLSLPSLFFFVLCRVDAANEECVLTSLACSPGMNDGEDVPTAVCGRVRENAS